LNGAPGTAEDLEDAFENAPCGYVIADKDGRIRRANATLAGWIDRDAADLAGQRFSDLLSIGGQLFYETHFAPMLRMQGHFSEVALDLARAGGERLPVFVNAVERRDAQDKPLFIRFTLFDASARRRYERDLATARSDAERSLQSKEAEAELREQFIAVLGHDLRNPLAAILSGLSLLKKEPLSSRGQRVVELMGGSIVRASGLVDNVMDFARARLGGGIGLGYRAEIDPAPVIEQIVSESRAIARDRMIETVLAIDAKMNADRGRLGQMLSNLLGNALTHGAADQPVRVAASTADGWFELSVANGGAPIPPEVMASLFEPFSRGGADSSRQGLGLGLHIAAEIAKAHGGTLSATSDAGETRFTFRMPLGPIG